MSKPFYTSAANRDLADILEFIGRDNPTAALASVKKIENKCSLIANNPTFGDLQEHLGFGVRANAVGRFIIFHREANARVEILRVIPGDRNITQL